MTITKRIPNESPEPPQQEVQGVSLTDKEIADYRRLFKAEFGVELTTAQALEKGLRLVGLLKVVLQATAGHNSINSSTNGHEY